MAKTMLSQSQPKLQDQAMLFLLTALESEEMTTQRSLAKRLGLALGMTNSLIKRAARKGFVKISKAPAKRFAYYLTPEGFSEKSRLVSEYLSASLDFFRQARFEFKGVYGQAFKHGHKRLALFGTGELADIAMISAGECNVEVLAIIQPKAKHSHFSSLPIVNALETVCEYNFDAVVLTCANNPQESYDLLLKHFSEDQIYTVPLLNVSRQLLSGNEV